MRKPLFQRDPRQSQSLSTEGMVGYSAQLLSLCTEDVYWSLGPPAALANTSPLHWPRLALRYASRQCGLTDWKR